MESLNLEEENIMKDIKTFLDLELNYTAIKYTRNLFRLEKKTNAVKGRTPIGINNLLESEEEKGNCYKLVRVSNFWSSNYIEHENDSDKPLSIEECLKKIGAIFKRHHK